MYEPKQTEISDKAQELLGDWLNEDDALADATVMNMPLLRALLNASPNDLSDALLDFKQGLDKYAKQQKDFDDEAIDFLMGQVGYVKQTDVDDYKFIFRGRDAE